MSPRLDPAALALHLGTVAARAELVREEGLR